MMIPTLYSPSLAFSNFQGNVDWIQKAAAMSQSLCKIFQRIGPVNSSLNSSAGCWWLLFCDAKCSLFVFFIAVLAAADAAQQNK